VKYKGYFFDLDGVAYEGTKVIPTCRDFVNDIIEKGIKVCFLTNNSSRTPKMVSAPYLWSSYKWPGLMTSTR